MTRPPSKPSTPSGPPTPPTPPGRDRPFACNGIDAITGDYLWPAPDVHQLAHVARAGRPIGDERGELRARALAARQANFAVVEGVDPNDLAQAGWAVVLPQLAAGDAEAAARQHAILAALAPLLAHRRAEAGDALYREYRDERGYRAGETKQQYLARLGAGPGPARPSKVPYYLLLVATPDEISYHFQYQLDVHYAVGRIAFDTVEDYARYARSVVAAETGAVHRRRHATLFGVANANDEATGLSAAYLVRPLADYITSRQAHHGFSVERHLGDAATRGRLADILRDPPALLFTASHGMGFPSGDPGQHARQGALLCQDWGGPGHPVERAHYFAGEDLPVDADLRGMIGVVFACYGGGTPTRDEFTQRALGEVHARPLAPAPLVAQLPQRMLAHPAGGALAVVGHVDRAWGSAFLWIDPQGQRDTIAHLDVFESMLDGVLAGKRLGYAMEAFNLRYAELAADLSERLEQSQIYDQPVDDQELAAMWIYHNDARNYAVLGDPAVRIPDNRAERATGEPRPSAAIASVATPAAPTSSGGAREMSEPPRPAAVAAPDPGPDAPPDVTGEPRSFGWFAKPTEPRPDAGGEPAGFVARLGTRLGDMLSEVLNDVAVLEVKTYTSDDLTAIAGGTALPASGARLRAYTRCELDGDTEACVPVTATGAVDEALWALHLELVKQAQTHRAELLKTVLALFSRG